MPLLITGGFALACKTQPHFFYNKTLPGVLKKINNAYGPYDSCLSSASSPSNPGSIQNCSLGDLSKNKPNVLIVGDSHAMALAGMLNLFLTNAQLKGYLVTQAGTPYLVGNIQDWRDNMPMKRNDLLTKMIIENQYSYVVLGGFWNEYTDKILTDKKYSGLHKMDGHYTEFETGLNNAVETIINAGSIPMIFYDVPPLLKISTFCGLTRLKLGLSDCYNSADEIARIQVKTRKILLGIKAKYPSVRLVDPNRIICQKEHCLSAIEGLPIYSDGSMNSHLNIHGSALVGEMYLRKFKNPFA